MDAELTALQARCDKTDALKQGVMLVLRTSCIQLALRGIASMDLFVHPGAIVQQREEVLAQWYRLQLKQRIAPLLVKWQRLLRVQLTAWGVKKMKTKWGSCNPAAKRIWLNLELAKKPEA